MDRRGPEFGQKSLEDGAEIIFFSARTREGGVLLGRRLGPTFWAFTCRPMTHFATILRMAAI